MSSVTFSTDVGGDGSTVTDDSNPTTGLANGGHVTRFVPALAQTVAVAAFVVDAAADAADSAETALNAPGTSATSTTSHNISTGSKTYTVQTGKLFVPGMRLVIAQTSSPGNANFAYVVTYDSGTGSLAVVVDGTSGSGSSITAWTVSISGKSAAAAAIEFVSSATASASATIDFTGLASGYDYMVYANNIILNADDAGLKFRASTNNGSSYDSGASAYFDNFLGTTSTSISVGPETLDSSTASFPMWFEFYISNPGGTGTVKPVNITAIYTQNTETFGSTQVRGDYRGSTNAVNAIRFYPDAGATAITSGTFNLYRLARS